MANNLESMKGKYALVTGGSRGIGRATCLALSHLGYSILINYKGNKDEALISREMVIKNGVEAEILKFDVSKGEEVKSVLGGWIESNPEKLLEVLVNNAGIRQDGLMVWMTDEQWKNVIGTSLDGFFLVTRMVLNGMLTRRYGRIINVVSLSGLKGNAGQVNYSAAKAGVVGGTKALAQEIARRGVTVNAVAPGFISTDMTQDLNELELKRIIPTQRFGTPEEVAEVIAFLASPKSSYVTGEVIHVNGGLYS